MWFAELEYPSEATGKRERNIYITLGHISGSKKVTVQVVGV